MSANRAEFELPEDIYMGLKLYKIEKYKTPKEKIKEMLRVRMGFQIRNPMSDPMTSIEFFPYRNDIIDHAQKQTFLTDANPSVK